MKDFSYKNKRYNQALNIESINNGIILPLYKGKGGVLDNNKNFVPLSYHDG